MDSQPPATSSSPTSTTNPLTSASWSDRRGLFQRGKELHDPAKPRTLSNSSNGEAGGGMTESIRRASTTSSNNNTTDKSMDKTLSNSSGGSRRRSSNTALFNNLQNQKRGSQDYGERRASWAEMQGGGNGVMSGWYNKTFRGMNAPSGSANGGAGAQGAK